MTIADLVQSHKIPFVAKWVNGDLCYHDKDMGIPSAKRKEFEINVVDRNETQVCCAYFAGGTFLGRKWNDLTVFEEPAIFIRNGLIEEPKPEAVNNPPRKLSPPIEYSGSIGFRKDRHL